MEWQVKKWQQEPIIHCSSTISRQPLLQDFDMVIQICCTMKEWGFFKRINILIWDSSDTQVPCSGTCQLGSWRNTLLFIKTDFLTEFAVFCWGRNGKYFCQTLQFLTSLAGISSLRNEIIKIRMLTITCLVGSSHVKIKDSLF